MPSHDLLRIYALATLCAPGWPRAIDLRGGIDAAERDFLRSLLSTPEWAVITAANPRGQVLDAEANARRHAELERALEGRRIERTRCDGRSPDGSHIEIGFAVALPRDEAVTLAREFEQLAIYWFDGTAITVVPSYTPQRG